VGRQTPQPEVLGVCLVSTALSVFLSITLAVAKCSCLDSGVCTLPENHISPLPWLVEICQRNGEKQRVLSYLDDSDAAGRSGIVLVVSISVSVCVSFCLSAQKLNY